MATRKPPVSPALKLLRKGLSALKKLGLFKGDARNAKGGWRQKSILKSLSGVLTGKAAPVKVTPKAARGFKLEGFTVKNNRVVVPVKKNEKPRFNPKTGNITSKREEYGVKFRRIVVRKRIASPQDIPDNPPKNKKWLYKLPHNPLRDRSGVVELLLQYKGKKGFMEALDIYELDASEFPDDPDADDYAAADAAITRANPPAKRTRAGTGKRRASRKGKGK